MNFLLTGGAGYIGSHAALSLLDAGHNVHIIDDLSTGNESLIPKNAFLGIRLSFLVLFKLKNLLNIHKNILIIILKMQLNYLKLVKIMD